VRIKWRVKRKYRTPLFAAANPVFVPAVAGQIKKASAGADALNAIRAGRVGKD
jgi:hypothetical protein